MVKMGKKRLHFKFEDTHQGKISQEQQKTALSEILFAMLTAKAAKQKSPAENKYLNQLKSEENVKATKRA